MSIFSRIRENKSLRRELESAQAQNAKYLEVQEILTQKIIHDTEYGQSYVGNEFRDYPKAVAAIADRYNCRAAWGNLQTGVCVDLRAAFVLGEGVKVVHTTKTRKEAQRELDWCRDFFEYNGFDGEMTQEIAKEAEIEGKIALRIKYDVEPYKAWPGMITTRYVSWLSKRYKIEADPSDYLWYKRLFWEATGTDPGGSIPEEEFVYKKFGGQLNKPNEAQPKLMRCLTQIDRLDKALRDWREINHLFASPTAVLKLVNPAEVPKVRADLDKMNWKIGKFLTTTGEFMLVGADMQGVESLRHEIETNVKMISGATGIPIHYLGLLDLLKNRATGDNTRELVMAATARERMIWRGAFEELIVKAMVMFNQSAYGQKSIRLDPYKVRVEIPLITQDHWDHIERVLIPAAAQGIISKEHVAAQIPGVDLESEAEKRDTAAAKEAERSAAELENLRLRMRLPGHPGEGDEE